MLIFILFIWLINLTDYGGPVAIYLPQSNVLPVFIPIKDNNNNDENGKHATTSQQDRVNGFKSLVDDSNNKKVEEPADEDDDEEPKNQEKVKKSQKHHTMSTMSDKNGAHGQQQQQQQQSMTSRDPNESINGNREKSATRLLTSSTNHESTINEQMNQLLLHSSLDDGDASTSSGHQQHPSALGMHHHFEHVDEQLSSGHPSNQGDEVKDDHDQYHEKAGGPTFESVMLKDEEENKDSLLTSSLSDPSSSSSSSPSSDGPSLSPFPSTESLDSNEDDISSSSSSPSSPLTPSISAYSSIDYRDSSNLNSFSLSSLLKRLKPFQSAESSSSSSSPSTSSNILGSSVSNTLMPDHHHHHQHHPHSHQSIFSQHHHHLLNLGDANVDHGSSSKSSILPLTLTGSDFTRSLQQALSASSSSSSLSSPSSSSSFLPSGISSASSSSSSTPNELFNMLSLFQQINDNTMSTEKDDLNNLQWFKPILSSNSYSPTISSSPVLASSSSSLSSLSSSSSPSNPSSSSYLMSSSPNGHKTRTIILPIMSDSLLQSNANPFYEALLQSLQSASSPSPSPSSSLSSSSTLKLLQDSLNANSELNYDGSTNSQSNIDDISGLSGGLNAAVAAAAARLNGLHDDGSAHSALSGSLVDTSLGKTSHPYVVVDEEFNANGINLLQGYKPDIMGILTQGPPCVDHTSSSPPHHKDHSDHPKAGLDGDRHADQPHQDQDQHQIKKPSCPHHHHHDSDHGHHHYPNSADKLGVHKNVNNDHNENNKNINNDRHQHHHHHHHHHQPHKPHQSDRTHEPNSDRLNNGQDKSHSHLDDDKEEKYDRPYNNNRHHQHDDDDKELVIPRNRTAFRSIPFIKGAYRYKPDAGYETV